MIMENKMTVEKEQALRQLLSELEKGRKSGETESWLTLEDVEKQLSIETTE